MVKTIDLISLNLIMVIVIFGILQYGLVSTGLDIFVCIASILVCSSMITNKLASLAIRAGVISYVLYLVISLGIHPTSSQMDSIQKLSQFNNFTSHEKNRFSDVPSFFVADRLIYLYHERGYSFEKPKTINLQGNQIGQ